MDFWPGWRAQADDRDRLAHWRASGALDDAAWRRAKEFTGRWPSAALWRDFLDHLSLWLAVALLGAAVICLIAANWDALGRFARLYGLQLTLVLTVLAAWRLSLARAAGQAALVLAGLLLGGLLALVGQTYQTGADTWQLFMLWAALLVPWTLAGAAMPIGLLWAAVANVALWLFVGERTSDDMTPWIAVGVFDVVLLVAWQWSTRRIDALAGRTGPRVLAATALMALSMAALTDILGSRPLIDLGVLAWLSGVAVIVGCAWRWQRDLVTLALAALSIIVVDTGLIGRVLAEIDGVGSGIVLLLALVVIGQASAASVALRRLARAERTAPE